MKKIFLGLILICSSVFCHESIVLHLEENLQAIGRAAFDLFKGECKLAQIKGKTPVFILPTGSTPLPFYHEIVTSFFEGKLDLSKAIFFNMDEYAGLDQMDPNSYAHYMDTHLYQYMVPELNFEKLRYFGLNPLTKKECLNKKLRQRLNEALDLFCTRLIEKSGNSNNALMILDELVLQHKQDNRSFRLLAAEYMNDDVLPSITSLKSLIEKDISLRPFSPLKKNIHRWNGGASDLEKEAERYGSALSFYLDHPDYRVICFAGIGRDPAHIAFNDFITEEQFLKNNQSEEEKNQLALNSTTRLISLSEGTRKSNARFFDEDMEKVPSRALTIGFKEILSSDHIVVMAGGTSKQNAIYQTFSKSSSYHTPASLLKFYTQGKLTFVLDFDSYGLGKPNSLFSYNTLQNKPFKALEIKKKIQDQISFWEVPNQARPALIFRDQKESDPYIQYAKLPHNQKVLWVKAGKLHYSLWHRLKKLKNTQKVIELSDFESINNQILSFKPDLIILPYSQSIIQMKSKLIETLKKHFPNQAILGLFYDIGASYCNVHLPITKKELKLKSLALKKFHLSQSKRSNFDLITHEMGKAHDPLSNYLESFTFYNLKLVEGTVHRIPYPKETYIRKKGKIGGKYKKKSTFVFEEKDLVLAIAPHPDDIEIGSGALVSFLGHANIPVVTVNATSGNRALIKKRDLLKHPYLPKELLTKITESTSDYIEDKSIKGKTRELESKGALTFLNPKSKFYQLNLPFYENKIVSDEDREKVDLLFEDTIQNPSRLIILLPHPIDQHKTHRQTHELFKERIIHYLKNHPNQEVILAYYSTPWTGSWNLYDYSSSHGSKLSALIGAEQLVGNGQEAIDLDTLGGSLARRYRLIYLK